MRAFAPYYSNFMDRADIWLVSVIWNKLKSQTKFEFLATIPPLISRLIEISVINHLKHTQFSVELPNSARLNPCERTLRCAGAHHQFCLHDLDSACCARPRLELTTQPNHQQHPTTNHFIMNSESSSLRRWTRGHPSSLCSLSLSSSLTPTSSAQQQPTEPCWLLLLLQVVAGCCSDVGADRQALSVAFRRRLAERARATLFVRSYFFLESSRLFCSLRAPFNSCYPLPIFLEFVSRKKNTPSRVADNNTPKN